MPNFEAKEKHEELRGETPPPKPVDVLPTVDVTAFGLIGDAGSALHRAFCYATRRHTLNDLLRPGYFGAGRRANDVRDFGVKLWDVIFCTLGNDPATAIEVDLRVVNIGTSREEPVTVAQGPVRKFTPVAEGKPAV